MTSQFTLISTLLSSSLRVKMRLLVVRMTIDMGIKFLWGLRHYLLGLWLLKESSFKATPFVYSSPLDCFVQHQATSLSAPPSMVNMAIVSNCCRLMVSFDIRCPGFLLEKERQRSEKAHDQCSAAVRLGMDFLGASLPDIRSTQASIGP